MKDNGELKEHERLVKRNYLVVCNGPNDNNQA